MINNIIGTPPILYVKIKLIPITSRTLKHEIGQVAIE
jgi:hypothetical protein